MRVLLRLVACLPVICQSSAGDATRSPTSAPACIEIRDQYDAPQRLAFPSTNVVVLTIADKKGAEQIDDWVAALKSRYDGRIELRGFADVAGVPVFLRGKVRKKFQETRPYPVMMDWSGKVCAQFGFQPGVVNVLVIARDGNIHARVAGSAREPALHEVFTAIDAAMVKSASVQTNSTLRPAAFRQP